MVPPGLVLHKRHPAALHRVRDDDRGLALEGLGLAESPLQVRHVVALGVEGAPAKGGPPVVLAVLGHDLFGAAGDLQPVPIHHGAEIVKPVVSGSHGPFPHGALRQLAVPHDHIHPVGLPLALARQGHAHPHGQTVAQGAGVHLDASYLVVGVADVLAAKLGKRLQIFLREKALVAEDAVQRLHRVAFAQDEMVAVHGGEVLRSHVHHPVVQHVQDVAHAEIPADMSRFGPVDHVQHPQAQGV